MTIPIRSVIDGRVLGRNLDSTAGLSYPPKSWQIAPLRGTQVINFLLGLSSVKTQPARPGPGDDWSELSSGIISLCLVMES